MASRSLGTLTLDLVARIGGFTSGMTQAERAADKSLSAIEKRAFKFGQVLGAGLKTAAVSAVAGVTALAASLQLTINGLDDLNKSAQQVGVTTEELSKLAYAGELADVSLESLTASLGKLTKAQAEALDTGSETAKVFDALGIAVKDADGNLRSSTQVLGDFAEAFKDLGGSPEVTAAGFKVFGRSFQELIPLLLEGRDGIQAAGDELERFGGVITTEAGRNADEFNDNLGRLKNQFQAIFAQIATQLLPTLVKLTEDLGQLAQNGDLAGKAVSLFTAAVDFGIGALKLYTAAVDNVSVAIGQAVKSYEGWTEVTKNVASLGFADGGVVEGFTKIADAAREAADERKRLAGIRNAAPVAGVDEIDFTLGAPKSADEAAAANRRLSTVLAGTTKAKQENTKATREQTQAEKDFQDQIIEVNELIDSLSLDAMSDISQGRQRQREDFEALLGDLAHERELIGKSADEQERLNLLRYAGIELTEEQTKALEGSLSGLQEQRRVIEDQTVAMDGLRGSFVDFLNDVKDGASVWDSLKSAVDSFADTLFQLAASNIAEQLFGQGGSTQGGAAGGGWASLLASFFGGGRANGGPVNPNTLYEVNERGKPEMLTVGNRDYLMMGGQAGMVTANAGGGVSMVNNFNYSAPYDPRTEEQKNARLSFETRRASQRNS